MYQYDLQFRRICKTDEYGSSPFLWEKKYVNLGEIDTEIFFALKCWVTIKKNKIKKIGGPKIENRVCLSENEGN